MCSSRTASLGEIGFSLPSSDRDLDSTEPSSETVTLEIIGSTLRMDTVKGKPRTWFALVFAALTIGLVFENDIR